MTIESALQQYFPDMYDDLIKNDNNVKCFNGEKHKNGDNSPSMYLESRNQRLKCSACKESFYVRDLLKEKGMGKEEIDLLTKEKAPEVFSLDNFLLWKGLDKKEADKRGITSGITKNHPSIIIPYRNIDSNGSIVNVWEQYRIAFEGHKWLSKPDAYDIFGQEFLHTFDKSKRLYICEGVTDTLTVAQAGYQVIGVRSATAWKNEIYENIIDGFTDVVTVMDNDPDTKAGEGLADSIGRDVVVLPNITKDVNEYYIKKCGKDIARFKYLFSRLGVYPTTLEGFKARAKKDREESKVNTIDTDPRAWSMIVKHLHNSVHIANFVGQLKTITGIGIKTYDPIIKMVKNSDSVSQGGNEITDIDNCYTKKVYRDGKAIDKEITNFVVNVKKEYVRMKGKNTKVTRVCTLTNTATERAENVYITGDDLSSQSRFDNILTNLVNDYTFLGSQDDYTSFKRVIKNNNAIKVYETGNVGRFEDGWIFGNGGVDKQGNFVEAEGDIVKLNDTNYSTDSSGLKDLPKFVDKEITQGFKRELLDKLIATFGIYGAWSALGTIVSTWFSDFIYEEMDFVPMTCIRGQTKSGKSTLTNVMKRAFGFSKPAISMESTAYGFAKPLYVLSSLPYFLSDYDDRKGHETKRHATNRRRIQNAYDRISDNRGQQDGSLEDNEIKATVVVNSEYVPSEESIHNRFEVISLSKYDRPEGSKKALGWFKKKENKDLVNAWSLSVCKKTMNEEERVKLLARINELVGEIYEVVEDDRAVENTAIIGASFLYEFDDGTLTEEEKKAYIDYIAKASKEESMLAGKKDPVMNFFSYMMVKAESKEFGYENGVHYVVNRSKRTGKDYMDIRMETLYALYLKGKNADRDEVITKETICQALKKHPCLINDRATTRFFEFDKVDKKYVKSSTVKGSWRIDITELDDKIKGFVEVFMSKETREAKTHEDCSDDEF